MKYLHYEWNDIGPEDVIEVDLDKQAHVYLLDDVNYQKYKNQSEFWGKGGLAVKSPAHLIPPHRGHWHLCVDLAGYVGTVNVSVRVI